MIGGDLIGIPLQWQKAFGGQGELSFSFFSFFFLKQKLVFALEVEFICCFGQLDIFPSRSTHQFS